MEVALQPKKRVTYALGSFDCDACGSSFEAKVSARTGRRPGRPRGYDLCPYCVKMSENFRHNGYGITPFDYYRLLQEQGGVCAICRSGEVRTLNGKVTRLSVDHCHATGEVRGLLCRQCNVGLGNFRDELALLSSAARYLEASRSALRAA